MIFFTIRSQRKKNEITILSRKYYDKLRFVTKDDYENGINSFTIDEGKILFDVVRFADSLNFAISEKFKNLLTDNKISGLSYFPITIEGVVERYHGIVVTSKAGPTLNLEAVNNYETDNREFDIKTWDGSDVFTLKDSLVIVVTPKVKHLLESARITNIDLFPL